MDEILKKLNELTRRKEQYIATKESHISKEVAILEDKLLSLYLAEYVPKLQTNAAGNILANEHNFALISEVEKTFDKFISQYHTDLLSKVSNNLLRLVDLSSLYFVEGLGYAQAKVNNIVTTIGLIEKALGFKDGKFIKGSYLDSLAQAPEVREEIKRYILENISTNRPLNQFTNGFKELITGKEGVDGRLEKYYKQHVYDTFNMVDATVTLHTARELGLVHFIYAASIIKTSRIFCIKRAGKVFHVDDTKDWKDDPDLIDKATKESYIPLIHRGRYNCRHHLNFITKELAIYLGYKKAA